MARKTIFTALLGSSVIVLAATAPALAGEREQAREAISAADAKIHTAEALGAGVETPAATAEAQALLATARHDLDRGERGDAIAHAIRAQALADTAVGELERRKNESLAAAQAARSQTAAEAQDQVQAAQQQAAEANARADAAEQAAAHSAADAQAARDAAAIAQTPQVETTVTTQHAAAAHKTKTRVVRRHVAPQSDQVTTTTTVNH
jgi:hypothetical protein